jgi:HEAT repeat protein
MMSSEGFNVPREFQSLVRSLLHEDERLVCWRRPDPFFSMLLSGTLLVTSFAIPAALTAFVLTQHGALGISVWLFCVIVSAVCAAPLALLLVAQWRHSRRMLFLLTTERAICCVPRLFGSYRIFELHPEHASRVYAGGVDNLIGWIAWKVATPPFLVGMPMWIRNIGFGLVRRPRDLRQKVIDVLSVQLVARLKHRDNAIRREAISALTELAKGKTVPIHALAEALRSEDSYIRECAAKALGTFRESALPVLSCLRVAALDENPAVAQAALRAIEQVSQAA